MIVYKCKKCGNIVIGDEKTKPVSCCETKMQKLIPNEVEAATEKHIPVYEQKGDYILVKIGEVPHPMTEEHQITFIAQEFENKITVVKLSPQSKPEAKFPYIKGSKIYEYCNLHGLWVAKVTE